jgi:polyribonucleotide nucleotidyltransferase
MDFKVAGSLQGITAFQMDIKCSGITIDIMRQALKQAHQGRLHILNIMNTTINKPAAISELAPRIESITIDAEKIGAIIGPGGKTIKALCEQYEAKINIDDNGVVSISARTASMVEQAKQAILNIITDPEVGTIYQGTVKRLVDFGAFIEILPGKEGLCHISKLAKERVDKVENVLAEGQKVAVRLIEVDRMGRLNLSIVDAQDPNWKPMVYDREHHKKY